MSDITINKGGRVLHRSRNLRGMLDYARVSNVIRVDLAEDGPVRGVLTVEYADGAISSVTFASYHIMIDFVRNRRTWRDAKIVFNGPNVGYLTKPGIIAGD